MNDEVVWVIETPHLIWPPWRDEQQARQVAREIRENPLVAGEECEPHQVKLYRGVTTYEEVEVEP